MNVLCAVGFVVAQAVAAAATAVGVVVGVAMHRVLEVVAGVRVRLGRDGMTEANIVQVLALDAVVRRMCLLLWRESGGEC